MKKVTITRHHGKQTIIGSAMHQRIYTENVKNVLMLSIIHSKVMKCGYFFLNKNLCHSELEFAKLVANIDSLLGILYQEQSEFPYS